MSEGSRVTDHDLPAPLLELDRRIAAAVEDQLASLRGQIEERLRTSGNDLLKAADELHWEAPSNYLDETDLATFAATVATTVATTGAGSDALLAAVARIDRARTQPDLLSVLLEEARRFASRSAFFLTRPDGIHGWSSRGFGGFDRPFDEVVVPYGSDDVWSTLAQGQGPVAFGATRCARLAERLGTTMGSRAVLVPFVLRGQLAGALYADLLPDGDADTFDPAALQLLTHTAALSLETLALRQDAGSPTLRGASADRDTDADAMGVWGAAAAAGAAATGVVAATVAGTAEAAEPDEEIPAAPEAPEVLEVEDTTETQADSIIDEAAVPAISMTEPESPMSMADLEEIGSRDEAASLEDEPSEVEETAEIATGELASEEPAVEQVASEETIGDEAITEVNEVTSLDESDPETFELDPVDTSIFETDDVALEDEAPNPEPVAEAPVAEAPSLEESFQLDERPETLSDTRPGVVRSTASDALPSNTGETAPSLEAWEDEDPTVETRFTTRTTESDTDVDRRRLDDTRAADVPDFELDYPSTDPPSTPKPAPVPTQPSTVEFDPNEDATIVASRGAMITPPAEETPPESEPVAQPGMDSSSLGLSSTQDGRSSARGSSQVVPPMDIDGPGLAFVGSSKPAPSTAAVPEGEETLHEEAKRLARLLVSEIKLYNEEVIEEGRQSGNIYARLKEDIDRSRQMYDERIDPRLREDTDYFVDELVQRLAGGDAAVLGL